MMDIDDMIDILSIELLGVIPDDQSIVISTNRGEPAVIDPNSLAGKAYKNIAERILGNEVPFLDLEVDKGFFKKFARMIGFKVN